MLKDNFKQLKLDPSLVYLDSANSTLILDQVIEAIIDTYSHYSNVSRGSYDLAEKNTNLLDDARKNIASFINANKNEIIFNYSATIGINQLGYGLLNTLKEGDIILLSIYEHNSNLLIWQK
ncbi:MAG: aminotransferase class V-fold PLP-dependent enzyme, partial [Candidatus Saccharibacteria bacterium]|nr:aminotransferase class V-fold PLP-dependent enzyme [Candidatus Saccharibacteria bacterium]